MHTSPTLTPTGGALRKTYVDGPFGQVHVRYAAPAPDRVKARPVVLLVPSPNSAKQYNELLIEMGRDRLALAIDTPGYGESDPPPQAVEPLSSLTSAFAQALKALDLGAVDLFGHHSGAALALSLAAEHPEQVSRLAVTGVPYVADPDQRATLRARCTSIAGIESWQAYATRNWLFWVENRPQALAFDRAIELYTDSLSAGVRMNWLYAGVYGDGAETWLAQVAAPVVFLQIEDFLSPNSLAAAGITPNRQIRERPDLDHFSFITAPAEIAAELRAAFDAPPA